MLWESDLRNAIDPQNAGGVVPASLIHIKGEYDEEAFNEAFMMHTTTSPSYPIVLLLVETAAAMLRGNPGKRLINRSVERSAAFRKEVQRLREESDGWFSISGKSPQVDEAECCPLPGEQWHGFSDADANHMFSIRLKSLF